MEPSALDPGIPASREDPRLLSSLGGSKSLSDGCDSVVTSAFPCQCWRAARLSLDWEYRVWSAVPSEVHSLLKEIPGSGRLAARVVNYRLCSFLMYFKHSWDYQELSFTNGSVEGQSLSVPAPLQQLGGGAILLLSSPPIPSASPSPPPSFCLQQFRLAI